MTEEFDIGDTVLVSPDITTLIGRVAGSVCYRFKGYSGTTPDGIVNYAMIYKLDSTGEITYDGSSFRRCRLVLAEKAFI